MRRQDFRATLVLTLGLVAAAATGFLREATLAFQLGASGETDIYLIAYAVPEFLFFAVPLILGPAFIPLFAELRQQGSEAAAWHLALRVGRALLLLLLGVMLVVAVTAPIYLKWLAPGFGPVEKLQARQALYVMLPSIALMGGVALAGTILQVYRRFARPALATAVYNLVFVAVLVAIPLVWIVGRAALGVTLGAAAAFLAVYSLVWRLRPRGGSEKPERGASRRIGLHQVVRLAGPLAAGYAVHHTIHFVDRAMATTLAAGSVSTLNFGYRLALVAGQLSGLAVSTALFPHMAERAVDNDLTGLKSSLAGALRFVWMVGLPASGALIVLRVPLVEVVYERGAFDPAATAAVSDVLVWYAVAVLSDALCQPLWRVLYAQRRSWIVLAVNGLQTAIRILVNLALIGNFGINGLALSAAVGLTLQLLVLARLVRGDIGSYLTKEWWLDAGKALLATSVTLTVAGLLVFQLSAAPAIVTLLASAGLGSLTYLGLMGLMGIRPW